MNNNTRSTERTDNEFRDSKSEYEKKFEDEVQKRRLKTMNSAANPTEEEITACICNRRPQSVFCGICGEFFPLQRIRKQCTVHPKLLFAKDIEMCCQCKCEDPSFFYEIDPN